MAPLCAPCRVPPTSGAILHVGHVRHHLRGLAFRGLDGRTVTDPPNILTGGKAAVSGCRAAPTSSCRPYPHSCAREGGTASAGVGQAPAASGRCHQLRGFGKITSTYPTFLFSKGETGLAAGPKLGPCSLQGPAGGVDLPRHSPPRRFLGLVPSSPVTSFPHDVTGARRVTSSAREGLGVPTRHPTREP